LECVDELLEVRRNDFDGAAWKQDDLRREPRSRSSSSRLTALNCHRDDDPKAGQPLGVVGAGVGLLEQSDDDAMPMWFSDRRVLATDHLSGSDSHTELRALGAEHALPERELDPAAPCRMRVRGGRHERARVDVHEACQIGRQQLDAHLAPHGGLVHGREHVDEEVGAVGAVRQGPVCSAQVLQLRVVGVAVELVRDLIVVAQAEERADHIVTDHNAGEYQDRIF
jgi:hypothetical protein